MAAAEEEVADVVVLRLLETEAEEVMVESVVAVETTEEFAVTEVASEAVTDDVDKVDEVKMELEVVAFRLTAYRLSAPGPPQ